MKNLLAFILCISIVLCLAACGSSATTETPAGGDGASNSATDGSSEEGGNVTDKTPSGSEQTSVVAGFSRDFDEAKAIQTANEFRILRSCLATIDEDTVLTIKKNEDGKIDISFPAAECEGNVFRYEITVTDSCGKTENFFLFSYYCLDSDDKTVVSGTLPYDFSRAVRISVTPQDLWFKCGKPLTYNIY